MAGDPNAKSEKRARTSLPKLLKQNLMESADREPTSASCRSLPPALLCVNSGPSAPALGPLLCPAAESRVWPFLLALAIVNRRLQRCARSPLHARRRHLSPAGAAAVGGPGASPPRRQDRYFVGGADDLDFRRHRLRERSRCASGPRSCRRPFACFAISRSLQCDHSASCRSFITARRPQRLGNSPRVSHRMALSPSAG